MKRTTLRKLGMVLSAMLLVLLLTVSAAAINLSNNVLALTDLNADSAKVFVAAYDANGRMLFSKVQNSAQRTVSADFSRTSVVRVFETDANCCPTKLSSIMLLNDNVTIPEGSYDTVVLGDGVSTTLSGVQAKVLCAQKVTQVSLQQCSIDTLEVKKGGSLRFIGNLGIDNVVVDDSSSLSVTGNLLSQNVSTHIGGISAKNIINDVADLKNAIQNGGDYFLYAGETITLNEKATLLHDLRLNLLQTQEISLSSDGMEVDIGVEPYVDFDIAPLSFTNLEVLDGAALHVGKKVSVYCESLYNNGFIDKEEEGEFYSASYSGNSKVLDLHAIQQDMRNAVVSCARNMASILWACDQDMDFGLEKSWTTDLVYHNNTPYRGLPYTTDRIAANGNYDEFAEKLDGVWYKGSTLYNEVPGTDCGGQVRLAYAWTGAICNGELEEMVFDPNSGARNCGLTPLGDIDTSYYDRTDTLTRVYNLNGDDVMGEAYALLQPGDCVFEVSNGGEHIMLVTEAPKVVRKGYDIDFAKSTIKILEITPQIISFVEQNYLSNWHEHTIAFANLRQFGYIPMSMPSFNNYCIAKPTFDTSLLHVDDECTFHDLMGGQIRCNYNIFKMTAEITDERGNVVAKGTSYPNSMVADLCELDYGNEVANLPSGDYHVRIVLKAGFFSRLVVDKDISFNEADPVVYICDDGEGNGCSANEALGNAEGWDNKTQFSYKHSAFYRAISMLSNVENGKIVVCGKISLVSGRALERYRNVVTCFSAPSLSSANQITITSMADGRDYRKSPYNAQVTLCITKQDQVGLELNIGTIWENVNIVADYIYSTATPTGSPTFVSCGGQNALFRDTVSVSAAKKGALLDSKKFSNLLPILYGGYCLDCVWSEPHLTVNGGSWNSVVGGSGSANLVSDIYLDIGGKAVIYNGITGGCSNNDTSVDFVYYGDIYVNISGNANTKIGGRISASGNTRFGNDAKRVYWTVTGNPDFTNVSAVESGTLTSSKIYLDVSGSTSTTISKLTGSGAFGHITR